MRPRRIITDLVTLTERSKDIHLYGYLLFPFSASDYNTTMRKIMHDFVVT
jgi:hypothetical protein